MRLGFEFGHKELGIEPSCVHSPCLIAIQLSVPKMYCKVSCTYLANILIHLSWLSEQFQNSNQNVLKLVKHNTYCTKHKHLTRQLLIEIYGDKISLSSKVVVNVHIIVKFIYSEKATQFFKMSTVDLSYVVTASQIYSGDFSNFCGLLRICELY